MSAGFVGILSFELHLPLAASLKDKRSDLRPLTAGLERLGAAVAEVDHHDRWQRARITASVVDRNASGAEERLAALERFIASRVEHVRVEQALVVSPEELV